MSQRTEAHSTLLLEMHELWKAAADIWDRHHGESDFEGYVGSDFEKVFDTLANLEGQATNLLEWGSGLGVVAIMASRLGFEAYGIETESVLVDYARDLAEEFAPETRFVEGSFIPDEYEWRPASGEEIFRTVSDEPAAYDELDLELRDFDLVFAYPWPSEHTLFRGIMQSCGSPHSLFISYDNREGVEVNRVTDMAEEIEED